MLFIPALGILLLMKSSAADKSSHISDNPDTTLNIVNTGIFPLTPDAMGITFYIHLENNMGVNLDVATRMWECCETFDQEGLDCSHVRLMGGYKGIIQSGQSRNVTLFYPNLYVYNRMGECLLGIWYRDPYGTVKKRKVKVYYDTTLSPGHVAPSIKAYYYVEATRVRKCVYIDEDPLDRCRPVDCSRKYNGLRLFYSNVERRCLVTPKCIKSINTTNKSDCDETANLPDIIYTPEGNSCQDSEPIIQEDDIKILDTGQALDHDLHPSKEFDYIVCHNGNKSMFTGRCNCHRGWYSTTRHVRPTTLNIHMCCIPRFRSSSSLEEALDGIMSSMYTATLELKECIYNALLIKRSLILGCIAVACFCFSVLYGCFYKVSMFVPRPADNTVKKKSNKSSRRDLRIENIEQGTNVECSNRKTNTQENNSNNLSLYLKCYDHNPFAPKMESKCLLLSSLNVSSPIVKDNEASCSKSLYDHSGRLDTPRPSVLASLLEEESFSRTYDITNDDESVHSKHLRNFPKHNDSSKTVEIWKNTKASKHPLGIGMEMENSGIVRSGVQNTSSLSKSMAYLTYSTLPSDTLQSLAEETTSQSEDTY